MGGVCLNYEIIDLQQPLEQVFAPDTNVGRDGTSLPGFRQHKYVLSSLQSGVIGGISDKTLGDTMKGVQCAKAGLVALGFAMLAGTSAPAQQLSTSTCNSEAANPPA